jgi:hypothetical protein
MIPFGFLCDTCRRADAPRPTEADGAPWGLLSSFHELMSRDCCAFMSRRTFRFSEYKWCGDSCPVAQQQCYEFSQAPRLHLSHWAENTKPILQFLGPLACELGWACMQFGLLGIQCNAPRKWQTLSELANFRCSRQTSHTRHTWGRAG